MLYIIIQNWWTIPWTSNILTVTICTSKTDRSYIILSPPLPPNIFKPLKSQNNHFSIVCVYFCNFLTLLIKLCMQEMYDNWEPEKTLFSALYLHKKTWKGNVQFTSFSVWKLQTHTYQKNWLSGVRGGLGAIIPPVSFIFTHCGYVQHLYTSPRRFYCERRWRDNIRL